MAESTTRVAMPAARAARDGAGQRCVLCGEPNDCAQAAGATEGPCWCVGRTFPPALLERARAIDGGAACVCRRCLAAAVAEAGAEAAAEPETETATEVETASR